MKFIKLNSGSLVNLDKVTWISRTIRHEPEDEDLFFIYLHLSSSDASEFSMYFSSKEERDARFKEIEDVVLDKEVALAEIEGWEPDD